MTDNYTNFFIASAGASTAFIGLLFVGMSVVNSADSNYATRERRIVLAGSSFLALINIFFVSVISFMGGVKTLGAANLLMAVIGLVATYRLIQRVARAGNFARDWPYRRLNLVYAGGSITLYTLQLIAATVLLSNQHSANIVRLSLLIIIGLYVSALARAWEITGISNASATNSSEPATESLAPDTTAAPVLVHSGGAVTDPGDGGHSPESG